MDSVRLWKLHFLLDPKDFSSMLPGGMTNSGYRQARYDLVSHVCMFA